MKNFLSVKTAKIDVELDSCHAPLLIRAYKESRSFRMFCSGMMCITSLDELCEKLESLELEEDE